MKDKNLNMIEKFFEEVTDLNKLKKNRVVGARFFRVINANFNADFEGNPNRLGEFYISSKASMGYADKYYISTLGGEVFGLKQQVIGKKGEIRAIDIGERMDQYCGKNRGALEVLDVLLNCFDTILNGATFLDGKNNVAFRGVLHQTDAININPYVVEERKELLSPYAVNDNKQSTTGSRASLDEAHFASSFILNPKNHEANSLFADAEAFKETGVGLFDYWYQIWKVASMRAISAVSSNAKFGSENTLNIYVELKENSLANLTNLHKRVAFDFEGNGHGKKAVYDISGVVRLLEEIKKDVESVEIFFDPDVCKVKYGDKDELPKGLNLSEKSIQTMRTYRHQD